MASGIRRFRKKPVEVEAIQWDGSEARQREIVNWSGGKVSGWVDSVYFLEVRTEEGTMRADEGDWIIRGVAGEFYPCKPDIFEQTYEPAGDPTLGEEAALLVANDAALREQEGDDRG